MSTAAAAASLRSLLRCRKSRLYNANVQFSFSDVKKKMKNAAINFLSFSPLRFDSVTFITNVILLSIKLNGKEEEGEGICSANADFDNPRLLCRVNDGQKFSSSSLLSLVVVVGNKTFR